MLEVITNDRDILGIVPAQLIKAAQAEQQILKAVSSMLLQQMLACDCDVQSAHRSSRGCKGGSKNCYAHQSPAVVKFTC